MRNAGFWTLAALAPLAMLAEVSAGAAADAPSGPLVLEDRGAFFVGGEMKHTPALSGNAAGPAGIPYANEDDVMVNQMYVQYEIPAESDDRVPLIFIHGCCLSAMSWDDTPDGRMGWAEYFLRHQHPVYLPDQVSRARSGFDATVINEVRLGRKPPSDLPDVFIFGVKSAWDLFRFGPTYPETWDDQQFPVDQINAFAAQVIPDLNATAPTPNPTYKALADLAIKAGGGVIFGHSESGHFPIEAAIADPTGVRGIVSIEGHCFDWTDEQVARLVKVPTLIVFGDHLDGSKVSGAIWPMHLESCRKFAKQLNDAGGKAEIMLLPEHGLKGNTHMLMQDRNNLEVADLIRAWLDANVEQQHEKAALNSKAASAK